MLQDIWRSDRIARVFILTITSLMLFGSAICEGQVSAYTSAKHRFAITPPIGWGVEEYEDSKRFVVKFFHEQGAMAVVVKQPTETETFILTLVRERDFSESQQKQLASMLYSSNQSVLDPRVTVTLLANEKALLSVYDLVSETLGVRQYFAVFKVETIRYGKLYRVEVVSPATQSLRETGDVMSKLLSEIRAHLHTFVFLPP